MSCTSTQEKNPICIRSFSVYEESSIGDLQVVLRLELRLEAEKSQTEIFWQFYNSPNPPRGSCRMKV